MVKFDISGELVWSDNNCYQYQEMEIQNCTQSLETNTTHIICTEKPKIHLQLFSFSVFDNCFNEGPSGNCKKQVRRLEVEVTIETLCETLNICQDLADL